jgi:4-hydroxybenzoate polyprenyltransferase
MSKRITKAEANGIALLIIIGLPIYLFLQIVESIGWPLLIFIILMFLGLIFWISKEQKKKRYAELLDKYHDEKLVQLILDRNFWLGQTSNN